MGRLRIKMSVALNSHTYTKILKEIRIKKVQLFIIKITTIWQAGDIKNPVAQCNIEVKLLVLNIGVPFWSTYNSHHF